MQNNYLVHGANSLKDVLKYLKSSGSPVTPQYDPRSVVVFLSSACSTLQLLAEDERTLTLISNASGVTGDVARNQSGDFIDEFLKADEALLVAAGMDKKVAAYLFKDAKKTIRSLRNQPPINLNLLRSRLFELREAVCGESKSLGAELSREVLLRRSINVIGGSAIVATNAAADAVLGGIASALSQAYGGYVASKGLGG